MATEKVQSQAVTFEECLLQLEQQGTDAVQPMVELFAENARLSNSALRRRSHEHRGKAEIAEFWHHYVELLGGGRTTFSQTTMSDDAAGLFWTTSLPDNGGSYKGVTLLQFDVSGKVLSMEGYYDPDAVKTELSRTASD